VWEWVEEYGGRILQQKRRLGDSCDWERERFTMDTEYVESVQRVFVKLYEDGLIYRGYYLVNWCPVDRTALSDEEVDNVERDGFLWHIRYPLVDGAGHITVATTRPETMLGDTAVAVNSGDERYAHLVGQGVHLPLTDRVIPIIADDYVQQDFGTGALKVTPGHDKNDHEVGLRHSLEAINVMAPDGTINEEGGIYKGLDRFVARARMVEDMEAQGLIEKVEAYRGTVPVSQRSGAIIEPMLSLQWFVKMKPLAEPAIAAVRDGRVRFHPQKWANEYFRWLENVRDWCISRQLWWGHRIPVWYYPGPDGQADQTRGFVVSIGQPEPGMIQDSDVLDTWFSSWLFPFATLGWPSEDEDVVEDLVYFHPTHVLVSGYDILYFWIARMIMASLYVLGQVPYRDIFITGMIKDKQGRWMSKSLGNGIDPLDMIDQYGSDAVRFSLTVLCAQGQDIKLDPTVFEMGRNFANKVWNAFNVFGNFMQRGHSYRRQRTLPELGLVEQWMLTRLEDGIQAIDREVERFRLNEALTKLYRLFRDDYCDWYLELIKPQHGHPMAEDVIALAIEIYEKLLALLHPFMPFISEELWHQLRPRSIRDACIASPWPKQTGERNESSLVMFGLVQEMVSGIRNVRSRYRVAPGRPISAVVNLPEGSENLQATLRECVEYFARLARVSRFEVVMGAARPAACARVVVKDVEVFLPLAGMMDIAQEQERLQAEIQRKEGFLTSVQRKLQNPQFVARAPSVVVERERKKEQDVLVEIDRLRMNLAELAVG